MRELARQFLFEPSAGTPPPRYNIAPTQDVAIVRRTAQGPQRELAFVRWGLVPHWASDISIGARLINARADTVGIKPAFRIALAQRRCLVLADGYYEWQKIGRGKRAYHIRLADGRPFALAGLWETWRGPNKDAAGGLETCTIITTDASPQTRTIHDRMPVILDPADYEQWLDPGITDAAREEPLLHPYEAADLVAVEVGSHVNNARHEGPECLADVSEPAATGGEERQQTLLF
jgi:putative SOS response-associated peptidase YedK